VKIRSVLVALAIVAISFAVSLKAMDWLSPRAAFKAPPLAQLPPLPPTTRRSTIVAPIAISLGAIRDAAERGTPRNFSGKANNPVSQILENADIGWTASRGPIAANGAQDMLTLTTPLTGTLHVMGSLSAKTTGALGNALGGLLGDNVAKQVGSYHHIKTAGIFYQQHSGSINKLMLYFYIGIFFGYFLYHFTPQAACFQNVCFVN